MSARTDPRRTGLLQRGFDRFYGTIIGAGSFFDPATLCRGNTYITPVNDPEYKPKTYYYTDAISDNAVTFLKEHSQKDCGQTFLSVCRLHSSPLADACTPQGHCKVQGKVR